MNTQPPPSPESRPHSAPLPLNAAVTGIDPKAGQANGSAQHAARGFIPAPPTLPTYPQAYAALPINAKNAVCPHTGLRHAHLAKLLKTGGLAAGYVRVVSLKEPGARHGKTLFHVGDMLRWLDYLAEVQAQQNVPIHPDAEPLAE